jgi:hypothetical protein
MFVDGSVALGLLIAAAVGWANGVAMQLINLVAAGVCLALGVWIGPELGIFYYGKVSSTPSEAVGMGFLLTFGVLYAVASFAVFKLTREMRDVQTERPIHDRLIGTALGIARGGAIAYGLVLGFQTRDESGSFAPGPSRAATWVAEHSALASAVQEVTDLFAVPGEKRQGEDERELPYARPPAEP